MGGDNLLSCPPVPVLVLVMFALFLSSFFSVVCTLLPVKTKGLLSESGLGGTDDKKLWLVPGVPGWTPAFTGAAFGEDGIGGVATAGVGVTGAVAVLGAAVIFTTGAGGGVVIPGAAVCPGFAAAWVFITLS